MWDKYFGHQVIFYCLIALPLSWGTTEKNRVQASSHTQGSHSRLVQNIEAQREDPSPAVIAPLTMGVLPAHGLGPRVPERISTVSCFTHAIHTFLGHDPLPILAREVNRYCKHLKRLDPPTSSWPTLLVKGQRLLQEVETLSHATPLSWQEKIVHQTINHKLACHIRFASVWHRWIEDCPVEAEPMFEHQILPKLKQGFFGASAATQQNLLTYWEQDGGWHWDLIQEADVADWLHLSLYRDIMCAGKGSPSPHVEAQFTHRLVTLTLDCSEGPAQNSRLTKLLVALRDQQRATQCGREMAVWLPNALEDSSQDTVPTLQTDLLDLAVLYDLMAWLPDDGLEAVRLLEEATHDRYTHIKIQGLQPQLTTLQVRYPATDLTIFGALLVRLRWPKSVMDTFLQAVMTSNRLDDLTALLHFANQYISSTSTLHEVAAEGLLSHREHPCRYLHHALACKQIEEPLQVLGRHAALPKDQITLLLQHHLVVFDALYNFLTHLQPREPSPGVPGCVPRDHNKESLGSEEAAAITLQNVWRRHSKDKEKQQQALQLREILALFHDYGASPACYTEMFAQLPKHPTPQWETEAHKCIVATTFRATQVLSPSAVIQRIVACSSPSIHFAGDAQALRDRYRQVSAACQARATKLPEVEKPIKQWKQAHIRQWATAVRTHYSEVGMPIPQAELVAVLRRAVQLIHGFPPRTTQLFAVLTLLNPEIRKGRLAQVYTGEGKSLVVAMLATAHALAGNNVDVVTTSEELSIPEAKKQAPFFALFGLTVGENAKKERQEDAVRRAIYQKNIVYGTVRNFQFDLILTDFYRRNIRGERGFGVVLVDEVDSMLYDDRHNRAKISEACPAMDHLTVVLGAIWCRVHNLRKQIRMINGEWHHIKETPFQDASDGGVLLPEGSKLSDCSERVNDLSGYMQAQTETYMLRLLRPLAPAERKNLEAYRAQEHHAQQLSMQAQEGQDVKQALAAAKEALRKAPWTQEDAYIELPIHLQAFTRGQLPCWISSAIQVLLTTGKDLHYVIKEGKIVPVDYEKTGVLQHGVHLEDGFSQFLQIKEGLNVTPVDISTNFLSNYGYFKRYKDQIYGLTGTLGNETTRSFLAEIYNVDTVDIPAFKERMITGNAHSCYRCKELVPQPIGDANQIVSMVGSVLRPARNGRAVLVLCASIGHVNVFNGILAKCYDATKLFIYTGEEVFDKRRVDSGEIIISTNIAGRGTDFIPSLAVEERGGLHVFIAYFPASYRVELQNVGRTGRQGNKGTAQLVVPNTDGVTLPGLRAQRALKEVMAAEHAKQDVANIIQTDYLFSLYCGLEASLFPAKEELDKLLLSYFLAERWKLVAAKEFTESNVLQQYEAYLQQMIEQGRTQFPVQYQVSSNESEDFLMMKAKEIVPFLVFRKGFEKSVREHFINEEERNASLPTDVLAAFVAEEVYQPGPNAELARQYKWTEYERDGLRERWGLWLKNDRLVPDQRAEARNRRFEEFAQEIRADAARDELIKNPYYYVNKGHNFLEGKLYHASIHAYDRAIALDSTYSANARFHKAIALLHLPGNRCHFTRIREELHKAQVSLTHQKNMLFAFSTLVTHTGAKPDTITHVQHQLEILTQQAYCLQEILHSITHAQQKDWNIQITGRKSLQDYFHASPDDYQLAIQQAACNGLLFLFSVRRSEPNMRRYGNAVGVALLGITQIAAGVLLNVETLGGGASLSQGMIMEGLTDVLSGLRASVEGDFDWAEWRLQKSVSLVVSIGTAGMDKVKEGYEITKAAVKSGGKLSATAVGKQGMEAAMQRVQLELGKGIAKECASTLISTGIDHAFTRNIEQVIDSEVSKRVVTSLSETPLIKEALSLDITHQYNDWQNLLIKVGLELLVIKPWGKVSRALVGIVKGVINRKLPMGGALIQGGEMAMALKEVLSLTHDFLYTFTQKIADEHTIVIQEATRNAQASTELSERPSANLLSSDDEGMPILSTATLQERLKCDLMNNLRYVPSDITHVGYAFSNAIVSRIMNQLQNHFIRPAANTLVSSGVDKILAASEDIVRRVEGDFYAKGQYYRANEIAHEKQEVDPLSVPETLDFANKTMVERVRSGEEAGVVEAGTASAVCECPIAIYDTHGELQEIIGNEHTGAPLKVKYLRDEGGFSGHYVPYDTHAKEVQSGPNSCLYDALACQTDKVHSGAELREKVAVRLVHSKHTPDLYRAVNTLARYNPPALLRGGGAWSTTAEAVKGMDDWVATHPTLSALFSKVGTMAGGAMWLRHFTPGGFFMYMIANYGYDKLIALSEGNIDRGKAKLSQFFIHHDKDITQTQADYLANFTMDTLTDVIGRMAFHRVASQGFSKVCKAGKRGRDVRLNEVTITPDRSNHIFSKKIGKLSNTKENQDLLIRISSDKKNLLGVDSFGVQWYARVTVEGKQIYTTVNVKGEITGAGINTIPRKFSSIRGLREK